MESTYQHIEVSTENDVFCVHLKDIRMAEHEVQDFGDEMLKLIDEGGCRKLVMSLGPDEPHLLFSVFLAKLVMIHRRLLAVKGRMRLCDVNADIMGVFKACQLDTYFDFAPDNASAIAAFANEE
jgi:anti-sigma B factor antagonist